MKRILYILLLIVFGQSLWAQESQPDASKPTNFYTTLYNHLEYDKRKAGGDVMGYRAEFLYAPSEAHLLLAELPFLYHNGTDKFGIGDFRARYFYLPYKNYDKFFGAFGPSVDVFAPTGNFANGLGTSSWLIQPGVTVGLMAAEWIQLFPILSYQYTSKPTTDLIPEMAKMEQHGISFQIITPIIFSDKFFMQVTPIYTASNISDERIDRYIQELIAQYAINEKLQISAFYRGVFKDENHTMRLALVVFL